MGTNFYLKQPEVACPTCGHHEPVDSLHIGKSSAGWVFSLRIYPDLGISSLEDWKARFGQGQICDEYGSQISVEKMLETITERSWPRDPSKAPYGYVSWPEMCRLNRAEITPQGLLRSIREEGPHGPVEPEGGGTYQMFNYNFS